jgi:hypothetical protein
LSTERISLFLFRFIYNHKKSDSINTLSETFLSQKFTAIMAATYTPPLTGDDDNGQQRTTNSSHRRQSEMPSGFVLGRPHTGPGRNNHSQQSQRFTNGGAGGGSYAYTTDAEHSLALLDHLSIDFANLLNRTDISDCFLNVKGTAI